MKHLKKIGIVLAIAVAVVFVAIAVQWWNKIQAEAMEKAAINNLIEIEAAKQQWALEHNVDSNIVPTWDDLADYLQNSQSFTDGYHFGFRLPKYPPRATYIIRRVVDSPLCSYSGHTLALYGLSIHVKDVSIDDKNGKGYEFFQRPHGIKTNACLRLAGSIAGANVEIVNKDSHRVDVVTDIKGTVSVDTLTDYPVALIVSKDGFLTSSNSIRDGYEYNQTVLLQKKSN